MIVEDEPDILRGMERTLQELRTEGPNGGSESMDVLAFDNPEQALLAIERERPPIVLTDIVMDGMTGLQLVERAKRPDYQPKFIIVSGYGDFEFARQSIQLGVQDYILKPFDREELRSKIRTLVKLVREEAAEREKADGLHPYAKLGALSLRDTFLLGLCTEAAPMREHLVHRLKFWELEWLANGAYQVLAVDCAAAADGPDGRRVPERELELRRFAIGNIGREVVREFEPAVILRAPSQQWIIIAEESKSDALADRLDQVVRVYQKYNVRIGVSGVSASIQALPEAFGQAKAALRYALLGTDAAVCRYMDVRSKVEDQDPAAALMEAIVSADAERIEIGVEKVVDGWVVGGAAASSAELQRRCLDLIARLYGSVGARLDGGHPQISVELWERLEAIFTAPEMKRFLYEHCLGIGGRLSATHENAVVEQAKRWIRERYFRDITLQELAEHVGLSAVWLSQLFKRETGTTFSEYVVDLRMEAARRLLRETTLKVYEIAEKVGYTDVQHFGQTFKKKCGHSPKEFRFGR
ncbi:helix-turn-helix domain-containing protein [Paenibacillus antri]|uniref:helix-turn-helix domain-containing protein n=1 Tax=Paenibacillus antri TaxID=2582848 RepID=UPI001EE44B68|nr:helix-turn-helix domain-containing protein [Paenibacillus antri]